VQPTQGHTGPAGHDVVAGSMALGRLGNFRSPLVEAAFRRSYLADNARGGGISCAIAAILILAAGITDYQIHAGTMTLWYLLGCRLVLAAGLLLICVALLQGLAWWLLDWGFLLWCVLLAGADFYLYSTRPLGIPAPFFLTSMVVMVI